MMLFPLSLAAISAVADSTAATVCGLPRLVVSQRMCKVSRGLLHALPHRALIIDTALLAFSERRAGVRMVENTGVDFAVNNVIERAIRHYMALFWNVNVGV